MHRDDEPSQDENTVELEDNQLQQTHTTRRTQLAKALSKRFGHKEELLQLDKVRYTLKNTPSADNQEQLIKEHTQKSYLILKRGSPSSEIGEETIN